MLCRTLRVRLCLSLDRYFHRLLRFCALADWECSPYSPSKGSRDTLDRDLEGPQGRMLFRKMGKSSVNI